LSASRRYGAAELIAASLKCVLGEYSTSRKQRWLCALSWYGPFSITRKYSQILQKRGQCTVHRLASTIFELSARPDITVSEASENHAIRAFSPSDLQLTATPQWGERWEPCLVCDARQSAAHDCRIAAPATPAALAALAALAAPLAPPFAQELERQCPVAVRTVLAVPARYAFQHSPYVPPSAVRCSRRLPLLRNARTRRSSLASVVARKAIKLAFEGSKSRAAAVAARLLQATILRSQQWSPTTPAAGGNRVTVQ
jgi:hypothetical protein